MLKKVGHRVTLDISEFFKVDFGWLLSDANKLTLINFRYSSKGITDKKYKLIAPENLEE